jgi:hypothetical protein
MKELNSDQAVSSVEVRTLVSTHSNLEELLLVREGKWEALMDLTSRLSN